ncbi:MAG: cell wall hydrolase [Sphingomonas sp.]|nr:cell wall hydrolase [Sphingomonas sp.]
MLIALLALPVLAVSAKAAVVAYYAPPPVAAHPPLPPIGYESEDHFPGAALLYVAEDHAAPSAGTTGTIDIAKLAIPANAMLIPDLGATVRPATPFSMAGASAQDRGRALDCLATAVYYEAASESDDGERAVAQVILNRVRHPAFPATVCGVVYQGSERTTGCQFSYACDGAMARPRSALGMARATRIAAAALNGYVMGAVGLATHYHTYAVTPAWNRALVMTDAIGAHFFHRWKGYWGTAAAFSNARYHGGEPVPGPYRALDPVVMPVPVAAIATMPEPAHAPLASASTTDLTTIQPAYRNASVAIVAPPARTTGTDESQVLDRWKDSGKPLR